MILKRVPKIYIVILLFLVPVLIGTRYFINNKQVDFNADVKPLINKSRNIKWRLCIISSKKEIGKDFFEGKVTLPIIFLCQKVNKD